MLAAGAASAPGPTHGNCDVAFAVAWKHGVAADVSAHGVSCARVKQVIRYALNHGLLAPARNRHGVFFVVHRSRGPTPRRVKRPESTPPPAPPGT